LLIDKKLIDRKKEVRLVAIAIDNFSTQARLIFLKLRVCQLFQFITLSLNIFKKNINIPRITVKGGGGFVIVKTIVSYLSHPAAVILHIFIV